MKKLLKIVLPIIEIAYLPIFILGAVMLKFYRKKGPMRLKLSTKLLKYIGVFPILDNYYEPQFNDKFITHDLSLPRKLPGIKFNLPIMSDLFSPIELLRGKLSFLLSLNTFAKDRFKISLLFLFLFEYSKPRVSEPPPSTKSFFPNRFKEYILL